MLAGLAFAGAALLPGMLFDGQFYSMRWAYALPLLPLIWGAGGSVSRNRWPFLLFGVAIIAAAAGPQLRSMLVQALSAVGG